MSASVALYPVLSEELAKRMGLQVVDYEFEFDLQGRTKKITAGPLLGMENVLNRMSLADESGEWDPERHNLRFKRTIVIPNVRILFGRDGVAPEKAQIGIAVRWTSKPSRQRGVFAGDGFTISSEQTVFSIQGEFPPGILRDHFELSTILYLKASGAVQEDERHLANVPGVEIGVLDSVTFFLSGVGSVLPIFTTKDNGPLWKVERYWEDPRTDPFDETSFRILLNENHPDYRHLYTDGLNPSPLMKELFLSALQILIEDVLDQVPSHELIAGRDADEDSMCAAVKYMIETFDLAVSSKEVLAFSLRDKIYDKIGGIG